jgi:hypothetical protein
MFYSSNGISRLVKIKIINIVIIIIYINLISICAIKKSVIILTF